MGSHIVKFQVCDSCGHESPADAIADLPPGWGRLVVNRGKNLDLCHDCIVEIETKLREKNNATHTAV